jgi:hypothetical protein
LNDSGNEHPVFADACGDDGLDVEHVLSAVVRPDSEVGVFWMGTLMRLATGFCVALASASASSAAGADEAVVA